MAGAAVTIALQQLKGLLNITHFTTDTDFISVMKSVFGNVDEWNWRSIVIGLAFLGFLIVTKTLGQKWKKLFWVSAIAPLISVILSTLFVFLTRADKHGVKIVGHIKKGINPASAYQLFLSGSLAGAGAKVGLVASLIALTEGVAIGRTFAALRDYHIDGNKEMIAFGVMNLCGSVTSCYVATGSFSRSAVNYNAGVHTTMSNVIMSIVVLITLLVLTPLFKYTPNTILSAIIISAVLSLIDLRAAWLIWKIDKFDFLACLGAFVGVFFVSVEIGLLIASYEDNGPVIDAVVWHDGDLWRAALDTQDMEEESGLGKLADCTPLTNFRIERQYGIFTRIDACSYVLNIFDDGNVLSIVTDCSPHGTHVAGITAAHHPEEPLLNGVAPGAQIVSCKIGDTRLGSMEIGTGLVRALMAVVETKCDLINMSYGEPTSMPNYGRFVQLAEEVVNKHGVIFVSSAGNNGPSLTTVGSPGGTSSSILAIGAFVTPSMAASAHSLVEAPTEGVQYTWSSRGPTADGDLGVGISALGGAVAPVPKWTLQPRMLMNGTSMSSPCACGGVALILSALKAEGRAISPHVVRKALENTAAQVHNAPEEALTIGRGLLQVDRTYEYLQKCKDLPSVNYKVEVARGTNSGVTLRGVYLREAFDCRQASEWNITVKPTFPEDADNLNLLVPFEERVKLESGNPSFVKCPEYLLLTNNGRTFNIVVDPTSLKEGLHYTEVVGIDSEAPWRGPLFRIPVTICKPLELKSLPPVAKFSDLSFVPGGIERRFISVPEGTTWAEATLRMTGFDTPRRFYVNAVQLIPKKRPVVWSSFVNFQAPSLKTFAFPLIGGVTMELTIAQFWSSGNGSHVPATADIEIEYHSLLATDNEVLFRGSEATARVDVKAALGTETLVPSATLNKVRIPYRPVEAKLAPLSATRDKLTDGRQINALTLVYKFSLTEGGNVTPRLPILNDRMYDNEFESQFFMLCDSNKRVLATGDVYPSSVKLSKGDYTLLLHIRHNNTSYLEKLKKAVLLLDRNLEDKNSIKLSFSSHIDGVITGADPFKSVQLAAGESRPFYIVGPADDKIPKDATLGSLLLGEISYGEVSVGNKGGNGGGASPAKSTISFVVPPPPKDEEKPKEDDDVKKNVSEVLEEEVRDAKIKVLSSLPVSTKEEREEWEKLADSLKANYSTHLQLMVEILNKVSGSQGKGEEKFSVAKSFDEITERSLPYAKGGSKYEDFVHLTQLWLGRMQVAFWYDGAGSACIEGAFQKNQS